MMVSPYQALEVLGDEEEAAPIEGLAGLQPQRRAKQSARLAATQAATAKPQPSAAGSSSSGSSRPEQGCSSRSMACERAPAQQAAQHHQVAPCRHGHSDAATVSEPEVSEKQLQQLHSRFMKLVKRKGRWDHTWLVNCLNPVTAQHDPEVRSAYKQLPKPAQQAVWRSIPTGGQPKQPASNVGTRGVRGKTLQSDAAPGASAGKSVNVHQSPPQDRRSGWCQGDWTPGSSEFLRLLRSRGIHHHSGLTTALNLSAPAYDAQVRSAYKALLRPDQSAVWRLLPKESPEQGRSATATQQHNWQEPAATSSRYGTPDTAAMGMQALGVRPAMSRLGCRPGGRAMHSAAAPTVATSNPSFYSPGLGAAQCSADRFASSLAPGLGGLSWNMQEPDDSAGLGELLTEDEEAKLCVVCMDKACDALLLPCKHAVMCVSCAVLVKNSTGECPYCRAAIETVMCVH